MARAQFVQHRFVRISGPQHEADVLHRQGHRSGVDQRQRGEK